MKCEKCGSNINQGEKFCRNCGNPVGAAASPQIDPFNVGNAAPAPAAPNPVPEAPAPVAAPNPVLQTEAGAVNNAPVAPVPGAPEASANVETPVNQEVVNNTGITADEELLDAYIGKNATKIKCGGFSWCTFLFSSVYLFYRKMWLYGVIVLLAPTIISLVFPVVGGLLSLVGIIVLATKIKGLYVKDAETKISQIISDNPGKSKEEIKTLCASKGGTTIVPVIIYAIIVLVIPIIFTAVMLPKLKEGILRGQLSSNGYDKLDHLVYKVPDNMIPSTSNDDTYKSYSTSDNSEEYCHISLTSYYGATYENDPEVYLNKSVYTKGTDSKTTSSYETNDGTNWAQVLVETEYSNKYYYATSYKDRIYSIEYSETNEDDPCSEKYEELLESLKIEE